MAYFINRTFRKSELLEKADPMPKFAVLVKKHLYDKLKVAGFKYENNFLNLKPKIAQIRHFWFQI